MRKPYQEAHVVTEGMAAPVPALVRPRGGAASRVRDGRDATLFVRPSADISYSRLVTALDVAKGAGASRIGLVDEDSKPAGR